MTARAHVETNVHWLDRVRIHLVDKLDDDGLVQVHVARFGEVEYVRGAQAEATLDDLAPLKLPEDHARALYEALARYFGGAPDLAVVRADLEHERKRVDRLIGFLEPRS